MKDEHLQSQEWIRAELDRLDEQRIQINKEINALLLKYWPHSTKEKVTSTMEEQYREYLKDERRRELHSQTLHAQYVMQVNRDHREQLQKLREKTEMTDDQIISLQLTRVALAHVYPTTANNRRMLEAFLREAQSEEERQFIENRLNYEELRPLDTK